MGDTRYVFPEFILPSLEETLTLPFQTLFPLHLAMATYVLIGNHTWRACEEWRRICEGGLLDPCKPTQGLL